MGMSQLASCEDPNIHHTMYNVWAIQVHDDMQQANNSKARRPCPGPCLTVLGPMQDKLHRYIFELREQGMPVSISIVYVESGKT